MILLPIDFALPDTCHFLKVFLNINPHIHDLSFLDITTSIKSFTPPIPTYTPSLPISNPPPYVSLTKSFLSSVDIITTDIMLLMTALTSDQPSPHRNPPHDCHPPVRYYVSANTTYFAKFLLFVCALHSLKEPKSYSQAIKSLE